ncbi:MAG: sugar ABC transporter permease [bacterium]|nr:sugar ABC transporter permease [bacterium]
MQAEPQRLSAAVGAMGTPRERPSIWSRLDAASPSVLLMPTVVIVLALSIFPLIVSLYLSLSRFQFVRGGFQITFIGFRNYEKLLFGSEQRHFLGRIAAIEPIWWLPLALLGGYMAYLLFRYVTSPRRRIFGLVMRLLTLVITGGAALLIAATLSGTGLPGTLVVTLIFVFGSVALQYGIGLGLALLLTQNIAGKRFFRIIFLLPMMITPVGIGFLFRMLTNTTQGPLGPIWIAFGQADFSWVESASSARLAVIIGDVWQWTPFMFIILLAALEGVSRETIEAGLVDGANRFQLFRFIVLPEIVPVSTTVILIRLIETFKIVDMPNILTGGGPGTATESLTLHAYNSWRALDLGQSSAIAYLLLFTVTFVAMVFVNFVRKRIIQAFS